jgi:hypothetical protein
MRAPFNGVGASFITHRYATIRESDKKSVRLMAPLAYARSAGFDYAVALPATRPFRFAGQEWFWTSVTGWAVTATAAFAKAAPDATPSQATCMPSSALPACHRRPNLPRRVKLPEFIPQPVAQTLAKAAGRSRLFEGGLKICSRFDPRAFCAEGCLYADWYALIVLPTCLAYLASCAQVIDVFRVAEFGGVRRNHVQDNVRLLRGLTKAVF